MLMGDKRKLIFNKKFIAICNANDEQIMKSLSCKKGRTSCTFSGKERKLRLILFSSTAFFYNILRFHFDFFSFLPTTQHTLIMRTWGI